MFFWWFVLSFYHELNKDMKRTEEEITRNGDGTEDVNIKGTSIIYNVNREKEEAV